MITIMNCFFIKSRLSKLQADQENEKWSVFLKLVKGDAYIVYEDYH